VQAILPMKPRTQRETHGQGLRERIVSLTDCARPGGPIKVDLYQDVAIFAWGHSVRRATVEFLRALLGVKHPTRSPI
jgi:hypothetical protein